MANDQFDFSSAAATSQKVGSLLRPPEKRLTFKPGMSLAEVERIVITETLESCNGNKTRTAAVLGISLKTLYNRLNEYRALQS
jgi:two-component system response regulator AtoC